MNIEQKYTFRGFAGSYFLLFYASLGNMQESIALLAHYSGLVGGMLLTIIGFLNQFREWKHKKVVTQKELIELEIRKKQLSQLNNFDESEPK